MPMEVLVRPWHLGNEATMPMEVFVCPWHLGNPTRSDNRSCTGSMLRMTFVDNLATVSKAKHRGA